MEKLDFETDAAKRYFTKIQLKAAQYWNDYYQHAVSADPEADGSAADYTAAVVYEEYCKVQTIKLLQCTYEEARNIFYQMQEELPFGPVQL